MVDPLYIRIDSTEYLGKAPKDNPLAQFKELESAAIGILVLAELRRDSPPNHDKFNPFFYHDIRKFYDAWKGQCRELFRSRMDLFRDELDDFSDLDAVTITLQRAEIAIPRNQEDEEVVKRITHEVLRWAKVLRIAKNKLENEEKEEEVIRKIVVVTVQAHALRTVFFINDNYRRPFELKLHDMSSGKLLYDLAHSPNQEAHVADYAQQVSKYWNSSKKNPIYRPGGYKCAVIVKKERDSYVANVPMRHISQNTCNRKVSPGKRR